MEISITKDELSKLDSNELNTIIKQIESTLEEVKGALIQRVKVDMESMTPMQKLEAIQNVGEIDNWICHGSIREFTDDHELNRYQTYNLFELFEEEIYYHMDPQAAIDDEIDIDNPDSEWEWSREKFDKWAAVVIEYGKAGFVMDW